MQNIKKQKIRLTIFFSILVFCLAILLEIIFFSFKYYHELSSDKKVFLRQTNLITQKIDNQKDILDFFSNDLIDDDFGKFNEKKLKLLGSKIGKKISFIVLNKNNEVVQKRIVENVDFKIFNDLINKNFYRYKSIFILKKELKNNILGEKIIFFKKQNYTLSDVIKDILLFAGITLLFSLIFYFFGKKFVNRILRPVEQNLVDMENFIQNAGHEFKTPLSIIYSNLQLIKAEKKCNKKLIGENIEEIKKFNNLIDGLIDLSGVSLDIEKEELKLKKEIPELIAENLDNIKLKKINIILKIKNNFKLSANKGHFKILFQNLLQNAIKYNKIGGEIKIILEKNKLIIKDCGIGIKKENLGKVFDRFYREDNSKTGESFGIGLSLVAKICEINKWKISIESQKKRGTKIIIKF